MGRSEYSRKYTGEATERFGPLSGEYMPLDNVRFAGMTTYQRDYTREVGPWQPKARDVMIPAPRGAPAQFDGIGTHALHYPPKEAERPASFKRPQSVGTSIPFTGATTYETTHTRLPISRQDQFRPPNTTGMAKDLREFGTEYLDQYVPKEGTFDVLCPAARLPAPPPPEAAPDAYEGQHVLWDTTQGRWAVQ